MAAFANISLNDGQVTPVSHPFTTSTQSIKPDGTMSFAWLDFSVNSGLPIGANRLEMFVRMPRVSGVRKAGDHTLSIETKVTVPTLETLGNNTVSGINPQPTHAYDTTMWTKLVRNGRSVVGPVRDAIAFTRNFHAHATYTDTAHNYSPPST